MKAFLDFFSLQPEPSKREQRLLDSPIFPGCAQVIARWHLPSGDWRFQSLVRDLDSNQLLMTAD
jgi:hypothetical protein